MLENKLSISHPLTPNYKKKKKRIRPADKHGTHSSDMLTTQYSNRNVYIKPALNQTVGIH